MRFWPEKQSWIKRLLILSVMSALIWSTVGAAYGAGFVSFAVRRSPLRVRVVLPAKVVPRAPVYIKAIVRNAGRARLTGGTVKLSRRPRTLRSRTLKSFRVLRPGERRVFRWRVTFPKRGRYTLTVLARARKSAKMWHVNGARQRLRVRAR